MLGRASSVWAAASRSRTSCSPGRLPRGPHLLGRGLLLARLCPCKDGMPCMSSARPPSLQGPFAACVPLHVGICCIACSCHDSQPRARYGVRASGIYTPLVRAQACLVKHGVVVVAQSSTHGRQSRARYGTRSPNTIRGACYSQLRARYGARLCSCRAVNAVVRLSVGLVAVRCGGNLVSGAFPRRWWGLATRFVVVAVL